MILKFDIPPAALALLNPYHNEEIYYSVPYDIDQDGKYTDVGFVVVTTKRIVVSHNDKILHNIELSKCEDVNCESLVDNGILTVKINGQHLVITRFSLLHIARFSYVARGAKLLAEGTHVKVESTEHEKLCQKCDRALPGTRDCPHCGGKKAVFEKFWKLCSPYKFRLLIISVFMIAASVVSLAMPKVQKDFIDNILVPKTGGYTEIIKFVVIMLSLTVLSIIISVSKNLWCVTLGARISMDLRSKLYRKIQQLSLSFIGGRKPGDLMNRIVSDTREIRVFMEQTFGQMMSTIITMVGALILMLLVDWKLTLISVIFLPVVVIITRIWRRHIRKLVRKERRYSDKINSSLQDVISGIRVVKTYGKEDEESDKFNYKSEEYAKIQNRTETFWAIFHPILHFVMGIGIYFVTFFGGINVLDDKMSLGTLIQFIAYANILYGPLGWLTRLPRMLTRLTTSLERVYDVLDEEPEIFDSQNAVDHDIKGDVSFRNVNFGYKTYEPVLENINIDVNKGEMIGLVGPSGAGKSTMINLIMRLYNADEGEILVDGININNIKIESLHSQIGVVLQETFLFSGTILNNIMFAKPDASVEDVIRAAKMANAHDFICKLPDGYNSYVGERGNNLSGGERQRIAIARAILGDPKLLILDEATSSLDTESEYLIQQALERLTKGRTTFAIAHRLSTLRGANRLLVIDNRGVIESGTHEQLMNMHGLYHKLVTAQLQMQALQETSEPVRKKHHR